MASFADYMNGYGEDDKKKKKKKASFADYMNGYGEEGKTDIAPVRKTTTKKKEDDRTWFQKSKYFDDGYDFGDVTKTILGSVTDIRENVSTGILGMGEKAVDFLAMVGTSMSNAQMSQNAQNELIFTAAKNIGKDKKTQNKEAEGVMKKYDTWQKEAKKGTTEFVKKDLYDEEKIAKKIITAPMKNLTGIDAETDSVFGEKSDSLVQSGGQLLATAGLNALGVPWFFTTGAISFGAEAENALNQGATFEQASMSAAISAGAEILTEKLSGGIKFGGKTLDDVLIKPFTEKISSKVTKSLVNLGIDALGEGSEEVISGIFSNLGSALYKEESIGELLTSEEAVDEYIESFIGGAVLGGVSSGIGAVANRNRIELTENEQKVFDKVVEDRIAEEKANGTITKKKENEIRKAVLNDLLKGYIDTDTVESVLGGETYKAYKDTVDNETALQEEFNTLNKMKQGEMTGEQLDRRTELKQQLEELKNNSKTSEIKSKLSEDVYNLVKDSRLAESYREDARKYETFKPDFEKYKGSEYEDAAKKTLENAANFTDSKGNKINNTNRMRDLIESNAKFSADQGVVFEYKTDEQTKQDFIKRQTEAIAKLEEIPEAERTDEQTKELADMKEALEDVKSGKKKVNGNIVNGVITINLDSPKALNRTSGHEITHKLEKAKSYDKLEKAVFDYAKTKGVDINKELAVRGGIYSGVESSDARRELVADLVGEYLFSDYDFVKHLSVSNQNVFQKMWNEVKYLCKIATAGSKEARELEKVKRNFEKVYREGANAEGGTKYSISETTDGRIVAVVDSDILNEIDTTSWDNAKKEAAKKAASNALKQFSNGIVVDGITRKVNRTSRKEYTRSQYTESLYNNSPDVFADKMRAADVADDIVVATTNWNRDGGLKHQRDDNFVDFDHGTTLIICGDTKYSAEVVVGITANGEAVFYDVVDMTPTDFDIKNVESPTTATTQNAIGSINGDSTAPILPQNPKKSSDTQYSLSAEQETYFKDSKVRDENGNLKVMYHGTSKGGHTVFDTYGSKYGLFGQGSYFTDNKSVAESYTNKGKGDNKQVYETYLNITNPIDMDAQADVNAWTKALPDADFTNCTTNEDCYRAMEEYFEDEQYAKYEASEIAMDVIQSMGYDGITHIGGGRVNADDTRHQVYIAFEPEQIKNIDNTAPTESADIRYSLSDSLEKNGKILYNKNNPLAIVNRAEPNNNSSLNWVYKSEIFSVKENKLFHEKISEINQGSQAFEKNSIGEYMLPIENKIVFTDGNYDSPYVREIVEVLTEYQTEFEDIRESIYDVEKGKSSKQDAARYVQNTYGKGRIVSYTSGNNGVYGWENGKRKGKSRSTVVRNYLNKQYRRRNDNQSQETQINEIAPINETSSSDGVFFDGKKTKFSLSDSEGRELTTEQRDFFKYAKTTDEEGRLKPFYHGTARADRVGNVFDPNRATSGPMAFFTDNKEVADNYARDKKDTSIAYDSAYDSYETQFRVERNGKDMSVVELWNTLSLSERNAIKEKAKHITMDDDWENVIYSEDAQYGLGNFDAYELNAHRGNALHTLVDSWLTDGNIYGEEQKFLDVLKLVGIEDAKYMNPDFRDEKTYAVYLNITNPFDTSNISDEMLEALREAAENTEFEEGNAADMWDKRNISPESWIERLEDDIENGTTHTWTSIPDFVTDTLKAHGYDGIFDTGGKGGGVGHTVAIPFYSEQIKNVDNLNPTTSKDIRYSLSEEGEQGFAPLLSHEAQSKYARTVQPTDIAPTIEESPATVSKTEQIEVALSQEYEAIDPRPDAIDEEQWSENKMARADTEVKPTRANLHSGIVENIRTKFAEKGFDFDEVLNKAKNLSTWSTVDNIPQRVMEKAFGYKQGQILADETVNKVALNESEGIKWLNSFTDRKNGFLAQISRQYNIKPGSKKSAAAQMYAEGFYVNKNNEIIKYGDRELAIDFPDVKVQENIKGLANDPRIRQIYDETLEAINESRRRNLYPEIQRLDNYFLHFRAMEDTFSRLGLPFNPNDIRAKDLPTDLNGVTADLKPGQPFFASAMHREGIRTSFDLLGGLEKYLSSAKNQIYHIDDIQTLRALRNYIADTYGQAKGLESLDDLTDEEAQYRIEQVYNSHLSTFAKFLNEEANVLAGKTTLIDRGLEGVIGRRGITFLNTINGQVGSNMVGFNVSSSLTNILPFVQTMAKTNKFDFVKALAQTSADKINSLYGKSDGFKENSPVIIRRKGADRFYRTPFQKVGDTGYILMSAVDDVTTEIIARTKYNELTRKGMDSQQAHFETDKWVSRLMGDRSLGQMPQLYNSKMLGIVTKFQLEVRNQLDSQFYDTVQEAKVSNEEIESNLLRNAKTAAKVSSTFFQLAVLQHVFGKAFESVAGYNPAFDIIEVLIKTLGFDDDEEDEDTVLDNIEEGFLALLEDLPYTSTFTGGRIPISSALPISELIKGKDQYGNEKSRWDTVKEAAPYYLLPTGYGQLKKTAQGLGMFSDEHPTAGSYTDSGNLRFPVDDTLKNRVQAGVFGQWANDNARTYFDEGYAPLKEKQIQEYIDVEIPIKDYWQYREDLKGLDTLEKKFDFIADMDLPVEKKNILINNIVDRKDKVDLENYDDFENYEEFDFYAKNTEKYNFLQDNGVSYKEYKSSEDAKENYDAVYSWWKNNPEKVTVSKAVTDNVIEYRGYASDLDDIRADKDSNGKSIVGSAKEKKKAYIWGLDIDEGAKYVLFKNEYKADDTYNYDIIDYLNSRDDISYDEMNTICEELGFKVDRDTGSISWD